MHWISVDDVPAPKDRLILITSGVAWFKCEYHSIHTRSRIGSWRTRGNVVLTIWSEHFKEWICPTGSSIRPQDFKFWCDFTNPPIIEQYNTEIPPGELDYEYDE